MNIPVHGIRLLRRPPITTSTGISILTGATGTAGITADSIKALTNSLSKGASRGTRTITITIMGSDRNAVVG
jgi:hypothetical protein